MSTPFSSLIPSALLLLATTLSALYPASLIAQSSSPVPVEIENLPTLEEFEQVLDNAGLLGDLEDRERTQLVKSVWAKQRLEAIFHTAQTYDSCRSEIETHCAEVDQRVLTSCLFSHHDQLNTCCAINAQNAIGIYELPKPVSIGGIDIPAGSSVSLYDNCSLNGLRLPVATRIGGFLIAPGNVHFRGDNQLAYAQLSEGQLYKGISITNTVSDGTEFHHTGVPTRLRVFEDTEYRGIPLTKGIDITLAESGSVESISGIKPYTDSAGRVISGTITFHASGAMASATLTSSWDKPSKPIPAGTRLLFSESGNLHGIHLPNENAFLGLNYLFGQFAMHPNGELKRLTLHQQESIAINSRAYFGGSTIEFDNEGRVIGDNVRNADFDPAPHQFSPDQMQELITPVRWGVWEFPKHSIVQARANSSERVIATSKPIVFEDIELSTGQTYYGTRDFDTLALELNKPLERNGVTLSAKSKVSVKQNGQLAGATAYAGTRYLNNAVKPSTNIDLHKNGKLKSLTLSAGAKLLGLRTTKVLELRFNMDAQLHSLDVAEPVTLGNIQYDGQQISFHANEQVESGVLNKDTTVDRILYAAGTELLHDPTGKVIHSWRRKPRWPDGKPPQPKKPRQMTSLFGGVSTAATVTSFAGKDAIRSKLYGVLSKAQCIKRFGADYETNPVIPNNNGGSLGTGSAFEPALKGCGTSDEQAGILRRY